MTITQSRLYGPVQKCMEADVQDVHREGLVVDYPELMTSTRSEDITCVACRSGILKSRTP